MLGFRRRNAIVAPAPEQKTGIDLLLGGLSFGTPTSAGLSVSEVAALGIPAVYAAGRILAETVASAPLQLLQEARTADGQNVAARRVISDHWAARLVRKPNSWMTDYEYREWCTFQAAIFGRSAALKTVYNGEVRELRPLPAGSYSARDPLDPESLFDITLSSGKLLTVERSRLHILSGVSTDAIQALRPVQLLSEMLGLAAALELQQSSVARNAGRPAGVLTGPEGTDAAVIGKVRDGWKKLFGLGGEGGTPILSGDWKYQAIGFNSVDQQLLESRRFLIEEIARAFRVSVYMLGAGGTQTFASAEAASRDFIQFSVQPWLYRFEQSMDRDILGPLAAGGYRFDLDELALMRGSPLDQSEYLAKALGAGGTPAWITVNEARRSQGYPAISEPWADQLNRGAMDPAANGRAPEATPVDSKEGE